LNIPPQNQRCPAPRCFGIAIAKGGRTEFPCGPKTIALREQGKNDKQKHKIMKLNKTGGASLLTAVMTLLVAFSISMMPNLTSASGGSGGGGTPKVDTIKVSKCFYDAPTGQMLIKASSSDVTAHLYAYRPDGTYQGEVQNGGGSRYGGTVMGYIQYDPGTMTIISSSGGGIIEPTTPFQI
jgi:hypothetical protein